MTEVVVRLRCYESTGETTAEVTWYSGPVQGWARGYRTMLRAAWPRPMRSLGDACQVLMGTIAELERKIRDVQHARRTSRDKCLAPGEGAGQGG